ncbi:hypothetical protein pipiens_013932 [Culex pipiens pipiens]|uniref:GPI ethanolamine phosphate transferase 1 n=1 Tax=Culex pipiens pipiens TaxID=38569 RepID=A0ABD1CYX3_CULPP
MSLVTWIHAEQHIYNDQKEVSKLSFINNICSNKAVDFEDFRRSLIFVIYMLMAFFGTGNMATVSSFDPNWVRFFISTFSPFTMMILVVLKMLIPIFILVCTLKSLQIITQVKSQTLFLIILVICDIMSLNFFYLFGNRESHQTEAEHREHPEVIEYCVGKGQWSCNRRWKFDRPVAIEMAARGFGC